MQLHRSWFGRSSLSFVTRASPRDAAWVLLALALATPRALAQVPPAPSDYTPSASTDAVAAPPAPAAPSTSVAPVAPIAPVAAPNPRAEWVFEPSAQVRIRGEMRQNNYVPVTREDEYFITSRVRVALNARWRRIRLFAQAQDVRNLGDFPPGNDGGAGFGIHQGFAEVGLDHGYVRLGRQEINYGSERFLGALDWLNNARSFDGARVHLTPTAKLEFDAFAAINRGEQAFLVGTDRRTTGGDYFVSSQLAYVVSPALRLEANYFYRHDGPATATPLRERDIHAPSLRASGNYHDGQVRYDVEGMVQTGDTNAGRHFAYALAGDVTARVGGAGRPFVDAGASLGSGRSGDGDVDELENFFPTNHKFYGFMDLFGLRNVIEGHVGLSHRFAQPNLTIAARAFTFHQQVTNSASRWSNAVGATVATNTGGNLSRHLGEEIDLWAVYKPLDFLSVTGGYSLFVPGDGASGLGRDETQHWAWLMVDVFTP